MKGLRYRPVAYTPENEATQFGTLLSADYGADGLRAWKEDAQGERTYFLYDGVKPVMERRAVSDPVSYLGVWKTKAVNTWGANGLVSRTQYGSGGGKGGTDPVPLPPTFYTFDERGNVSERTDGTGQVLTRHIADAYGNTQAFDANGTPLAELPDPYSGFGGQHGYYTDVETGLVLCTYRYYDPNIGRWLNQDPISYAGGINVYAYVAGNPVNAIDPLGLDAEMVYVHALVPETDMERQMGMLKHRFERIPGHAFIRFDHPVTIIDPDNLKKTKEVTSIGFYPIGTDFFFHTTSSEFQAPDKCEITREDGETVRDLRVTKKQKGASFEKHLIQTINETILKRPGYRIPGQVCWDIAEMMWTDAMIRDGQILINGTQKR